MVINNLSIIARHTRIFIERKLQDFDIGYTEEVIIMFLLGKQNINQESIAKHFMLDKGAIAKTMNKLEEKEMIQRYENPENKREKLISLTEKGENIVKHINIIMDEFHNNIFEGLSESDIKQLANYIEIMSTNISKTTNKNGRDLDEECEQKK
jgi:MarR family transcriptional regulator for hemolysin